MALSAMTVECERFIYLLLFSFMIIIMIIAAHCQSSVSQGHTLAVGEDRKIVDHAEACRSAVVSFILFLALF